MVGRGRASRLPGVRGPTGAPARRSPRGPSRHPFAVPVQAGGHLVPDGLWGGVHLELRGCGRPGGRGVPQCGPRPPGDPRQGIHQGGNYRIPMVSPQRPRRTWVGGRQGVGAPQSDGPPAEALPRPKGRVVRHPRRSKRWTARPPRGGCPRPGGPPDSAPTSRGALGSTSGTLALLGDTGPRRTPTRVGRGRRPRYLRRVGVRLVTPAE